MKGANTRESILKSAFELSSLLGLESLSIGKLADSVGLSKSGLFSHFKSKEKLQCMVLDYTAEMFTLKVLKPAFSKPRGIPRIRAIADNWLNHWDNGHLKGGCPLLSAAIEFDDRPGPVQDRIRKHYTNLTSAFERAAEITIEEGQFSKDANPNTFAFEFYSLMAGQQIYSRLLKHEKANKFFLEGLEMLIDQYKG